MFAVMPIAAMPTACGCRSAEHFGGGHSGDGVIIEVGRGYAAKQANGRGSSTLTPEHGDVILFVEHSFQLLRRHLLDHGLVLSAGGCGRLSVRRRRRRLLRPRGNI